MYKNDDMTCRICQLPDTFEDETHTFFGCEVLTKDIDGVKGIKYTDIFDVLSKQIDAIKYLMKIIVRLDLILEIREATPS